MKGCDEEEGQRGRHQAARSTKRVLNVSMLKARGGAGSEAGLRTHTSHTPKCCLLECARVFLH